MYLWSLCVFVHLINQVEVSCSCRLCSIPTAWWDNWGVKKSFRVCQNSKWSEFSIMDTMSAALSVINSHSMEQTDFITKKKVTALFIYNFLSVSQTYYSYSRLAQRNTCSPIRLTNAYMVIFLLIWGGFCSVIHSQKNILNSHDSYYMNANIGCVWLFAKMTIAILTSYFAEEDKLICNQCYLFNN